MALAGLWLLFSGCALWRPAGGERPAWIASPKSDDSLYTYRVGHDTAATPEQAREAAFQDAVGGLARGFVPFIRSNTTALARADGTLVIREAEILGNCIHTEKQWGRYACWVQVRYPLAERDRLLARIRLGAALGERWQAARWAMTEGRREEAQALLSAIFAEWEQALFPPFDDAEARLMLGDAYRAQRQYAQARQWYESVLHGTAAERWKRMAADKVHLLPLPPRAAPLGDRWRGHSVALLCALRERGACRRFADLTTLLMKDCGEARLNSQDIALDFPADRMAAGFDRLQFAEIAERAAARGATLVLAVLFEIDRNKRGATVVRNGMRVPAQDAMARFFLVRAADAAVLYNGQFEEVAGDNPEARLAERVAGILVVKYLVPEAPTLRVGDADDAP